MILNTQIETAHQRNARGKKKLFSGLMCGSQFYSSTRMKDHIEKKSQVARPDCVRGLKEHTSRVHEGTKPFLCDSCEESFAKDSKLKVHIKGMQGGKSHFHVLCVTRNSISLPE